MQLRCAGAVSGAFDVGDAVTVGELIDALARGVGVPGGDLKVFAGARSLPADASTTLESLGVNEKTRLVVSRVRRDPAIEAEARLAAQEQARADRLAKIEQAAEALASREGERARFELEDQDGDGLAGVSENDRKALVCGLTLHQKGRLMLDAGDFADALGVFELAEEAFAVADTALTENLDNVPILRLDAAWAQFQAFRNGDAGTEAAIDAGAERLRLCREGFARAHGPNLERLRAVHGGCSPELGLYVRLELLEGVLAVRAGDVEKARNKLLAARQTRDALLRVVRPESVAALASMGIDGPEATRALRFCAGDVDAAAAHVMDARAKAAAGAAAAAKRRETERAARRFGRAASGALVDLNALASMETMGFPRAIAAEALRATENNTQAALDALAFDRDAIETAAAAAAAKAAERERRRKRRREEEEEEEEEEDDDNDDSGDDSDSDEDADSENDAERELVEAGEVCDDPLSAYDVDVSEEGAAIEEFLALLPEHSS